MSQNNTAANWRCGKSSLCDLYMLENEIGSDVTFLVGGNRKRFQAHKYILMRSSSVFQTMFCGLLPEQGDVAIADVPEAAFARLLRYIYGGDADLAPDTVLSLLYAAKKYNIVKLEKKILSWLEKNMSVESVCTIVDTAIFYDEDALLDSALKFVDEHAQEVLLTEAFKEASNECVSSITSRDSLAIEEEKLFESVMIWARAECDRQEIFPVDGQSCRRILQHILYSVRYPLMTSLQFKRVTDTGVLTIEESFGMFRKLADESEPCSPFSARPRRKLKLVKKVVRSTSAGQLRVGTSKLPIISTNWGHIHV